MNYETVRGVLLSCSLALFTIGATIFGVGTAKEHVSKIMVMPENADRVMIALGGGLIILGVLTLIVAALLLPVGRVPPPDLDRYVCLFATKSDVPELHAVYTNYFGHEVLSQDDMRLITQRSRRAFAMVYQIEDSSIEAERRSLVGSFKVLPVTEEAVRGLEMRQLTGSTLKPEHIARRQRDTAGFYVGDVFATTAFARGRVMAHIMIECETAIKKGLPIYARPLTKEGKKAMKRRGFVRVDDGKSPPEIGEICRLVVSGSAKSSRWKKTPEQVLERQRRPAQGLKRTPDGAA